MVPARAELDQIDALLNSIPGKCLCILIDNSAVRKDADKSCLPKLKTRKLLQESSEFQVFSWNSKVDVLYLNHNLKFSLKQGVGLARKIGCDLAAALISAQKVESKWMFNTDADARLPTDYFQEINQPKGVVIYPFFHNISKQSEAARIYEMHMDYYVEGLRYAGSPYAFHSIGSTLCVHFQTYCELRGFPKDRLAGEDFHFLNKAKKIAPIYESRSKPIRLSSRLSTRTPFGTGSALKEISKSPEDFMSYDPRCFDELKSLLEAVANGKPPSSFLEFLPSLDPRQSDFHQRFDALQTLRYIHYLSDRYYPKRKLSEVIVDFETRRYMGRYENTGRTRIHA